MRILTLAFLASGLLLASCGSSSSFQTRSLSHREITTNSETAQRLFDEGLMLCWGFNHDEAIATFERATEADPDCAMAWWGMAYALGPNINGPLTDMERAGRAYKAARRAMTLAGPTSDVEKALIMAANARFEAEPDVERKDLDLAYAMEMREVYKRFPNDSDVGVLYADSLMLLSRKWRQWPEGDDRGPYTDEIVATLEKVLASHPEHAGVNHFYIHSVEASTSPERALPASDRLATLVPDSGHLLHMPSHIYIRLGAYRKAIAVNERAVAADDFFFASSGPQGIYHYYRAHNAHFLIWAAMFQGNKKKAMEAAYAMVGKLPKEGMSTLPRSVESYLFVPMHVMMRFGLWEEILAEEKPEEQYSIAVALYHHARAVAYANSGRLDQATSEAKLFEEVAATIPEDKQVRRAPVKTILNIARYMMRGEILFKQGKREEAFVALRRAVEEEDTIPYSEPPGWMQPMRHALGALLLEDGRAAEAESVYREDLAQHAENGWSLLGLAESLSLQGKSSEAQAVDVRFRLAWADADTEITASCFCRVENGVESLAR